MSSQNVRNKLSNDMELHFRTETSTTAM